MEAMDAMVTGRLREVLTTRFGVEVEECAPGLHVWDDLGFDSLEMIEFMFAIEETFGILVSDEDADGMRTFGEIVKYVAARSLLASVVAPECRRAHASEVLRERLQALGATGRNSRGAPAIRNNPA